MKTLPFALTTLSVLATCCVASAADPVRIENSTDDLVAEVKDALNAGLLAGGHSQYIPSHGFHLSSIGRTKLTARTGSLPQLDAAIDDVSSALLENSDSVLGLPNSEWISVFFRASNEYDLIVRMKQNQPSSLEVWVDGELEEP